MSSKTFDCAIINTGTGNLTSLNRALEKIGKSVIVVNHAEQFNRFQFRQIVLPGQGRFGAVMQSLKENNLISLLEKWQQSNQPVLGICVGMQIFFEQSEEDKNTAGFGWLNGKIKKLNFPKHPMVGWARVESTAPLSTPCKLPNGNGYFVNSYALKESADCMAKTHYGESFCCAVKKGNLIGIQFHPEKSSHYGLEVLQKCLDY